MAFRAPEYTNTLTAVPARRKNKTKLNDGSPSSSKQTKPKSWRPSQRAGKQKQNSINTRGNSFHFHKKKIFRITTKCGGPGRIANVETRQKVRELPRVLIRGVNAYQRPLRSKANHRKRPNQASTRSRALASACAVTWSTRLTTQDRRDKPAGMNAGSIHKCRAPQ